MPRGSGVARNKRFKEEEGKGAAGHDAMIGFPPVFIRFYWGYSIKKLSAAIYDNGQKARPVASSSFMTGMFGQAAAVEGS